MGYQTDERPRGVVIVYRLSLLVALMTLTLLLAGALVTSNEAGDSVPDWPLSFGRWLINSDQFVANVRYEYSHRVIAGTVALATFALAIVASLKEHRVWIKRLAWVAFAAVVAQALIGGVRVLLPGYKAAIAVPHALVAQSFFATIVALAVFTSRSWWARKESGAELAATSIPRLTTLIVVAVLGQLVLGAGFRHQAFDIIPHIVGAVVVTVLFVWTAIEILARRRSPAYLRRPVIVGLSLLGVQVVLGILAFLARLAAAGDPQPLEPMISLTVSHVVVGAVTLAAAVVLMLRTRHLVALGGDLAVAGADGTLGLAHTGNRVTA